MSVAVAVAVRASDCPVMVSRSLWLRETARMRTATWPRWGGWTLTVCSDSRSMPEKSEMRQHLTAPQSTGGIGGRGSRGGRRGSHWRRRLRCTAGARGGNEGREVEDADTEGWGGSATLADGREEGEGRSG